jgi:pyrroline-5-carboxylate reductase
MTAQPFRFKIGFIGAGNMAEAICRSLISDAFYKPAQLCAYDPSEVRMAIFHNELGVFACKTNSILVRDTETIILAVKPQQMETVLTEIAPDIQSGQLFVSIAAGISTRFIEETLGRSPAVVRVMPNTPLLVGAGTAALCSGKFASKTQMELARSLFALAGITITVEESLIDAVTAVSGSGPAYFFYLVEAMVKAGERLGLSHEDALKLSANTTLGAAKMLLETGIEPEELRRRVTSPGGTTHAAISVFESANMKQTIIDALSAAAQRSKELGK